MDMQLGSYWFDRVLGRGVFVQCSDGTQRFAFEHGPLPRDVALVLIRRMADRLACVGVPVTVGLALDEHKCPLPGLWTVRCILTHAEARVVAESDVRVIRGCAR